MTDDITTRYNGTLERNAAGGIIRFEPPLIFEHTHPAPGSTMRGELESFDTRCVAAAVDAS